MNQCPKCSGLKFWRARSSSSDLQPLRCLACEPPPVRSVVREIVDYAMPTALQSRPSEPVTIATGCPVCESCSGAWIIEASNQAGEVAYACWTCGQSIELERVQRAFEDPRGICLENIERRERKRQERESRVLVRGEVVEV